MMKIKLKYLCYLGLFVIAVMSLPIITYLIDDIINGPSIKAKIETIEERAKKSCADYQEREALLKAGEFCNELTLECRNGKHESDFQRFSDILTGEHRGSPWLDKVESYASIVYSFSSLPVLTNDEMDNGKYINISCQSREVDKYINIGLMNELFRKYGLTGSRRISKNAVPLPAYISEDKAMKITSNIATKLKIPRDMVLERFEKNEHVGVWNAIWFRKKDGYRYKDDHILISVVGFTGELLAYDKIYLGVPCSTDVNVSKDKAIETGWQILQRRLPKKIIKHLKQLYDFRDDLLIIRDDEFKEDGTLYSDDVPIKWKESRLAWVIKYYFTGGLKWDSKFNDGIEHLKERESHALESMKKWREWGEPEKSITVQIDAITGEVIYITPPKPWYKRWFMR